MEIKVLGSGCTNCRKLQENVAEAVSRLGMAADIKCLQSIYLTW